MKTHIISILFTLFVSHYSFSQITAKDYYESGLAKHKQHEYAAAILDYNKSIAADDRAQEAFYNRGTCEMAISKYQAAKDDFTATLKLDPTFLEAYYGRASAYIKLDDIRGSLPDLDKLIELRPAFPNALVLRGQIRMKTGNDKGACEDFALAKQNGDTKADKYISELCTERPKTKENVVLAIPADEDWVKGDDQQNEQMRMIDYVHKNESVDKWTQIVNSTWIKGATNVPMDKIMNLTFDQAKKGVPNSKLIFIEKDENTEYPWTIFEIRSDGSLRKGTLESQLWYVVQGKQSLYTNFIAIKKEAVPAALKEKWINIFKQTKVDQQ